MVHGLLIDQSGEFMIQKADGGESADPSSAGLRAEGGGVAFEWHRGYKVHCCCHFRLPRATLELERLLEDLQLAVENVFEKNIALHVQTTNSLSLLLNKEHFLF